MLAIPSPVMGILNWYWKDSFTRLASICEMFVLDVWKIVKNSANNTITNISFLVGLQNTFIRKACINRLPFSNIARSENSLKYICVCGALIRPVKLINSANKNNPKNKMKQSFISIFLIYLLFSKIIQLVEDI